jgi:hypothetical protein
VEVSDKIHAPVALTLDKGAHITIDLEDVRDKEPVSAL